MFKPRHGYRSPITHRYRGNAKGCPIFSKLDEITSDMVEDHDECLECLAKLKNRIDIYRNLAENNKPSNAVIKSLQKLSSSSSDNRLKTCLQFLIIKVNESNANGNGNSQPLSIGHSIRSRLGSSQPADTHSDPSDQLTSDVCTSLRLRSGSESESLLRSQNTRRYNHRNKLHNQQSCITSTRYIDECQSIKVIREQQSPTHAQVSSSQDEVAACLDHEDSNDCKQQDWHSIVNSSQVVELSSNESISSINNNNNNNNHDEYSDNVGYEYNAINSHYYYECRPKTLHRVSTVSKLLKDCSTSTDNIAYIKFPIASATTSDHEFSRKNDYGNHKFDGSPKDEITNIPKHASAQLAPLGAFGPPRSKERNESNENSDEDEDMDGSNSMQSQLSCSSSNGTNSNSSSATSSRSTSLSCSCSTGTNSTECSRDYCNRKSTNDVKFQSAFNDNNDDIMTTNDGEFREPKLRLNEQKLQNIESRPLQFKRPRIGNNSQSGLVSNKKQALNGGNANIEAKRGDDDAMSVNTDSIEIGCSIHLFRDKPKFYINKQLMRLMDKYDSKSPTFHSNERKSKTIALSPSSKSSVALSSPSLNGTNNLEDINCKLINVNVESLLECAICGIRQRETNVSYAHGLVSCPICARYFESFLRKPKELFCAQDGNCLMTFDSRCQACWIKLCLRKFNIAKERRNKLDLDRYSPKLLSAPNLSIL